MLQLLFTTSLSVQSKQAMLATRLACCKSCTQLLSALGLLTLGPCFQKLRRTIILASKRPLRGIAIQLFSQQGLALIDAARQQLAKDGSNARALVSILQLCVGFACCSSNTSAVMWFQPCCFHCHISCLHCDAPNAACISDGI